MQWEAEPLWGMMVIDRILLSFVSYLLGLLGLLLLLLVGLLVLWLSL